MSHDNDPRARNDCDVALFDALYREHHRVLHAYLMGQFAHSDTAADLLQETFVRVWQHIGDARRVPTEQRRFWLFTLARNLAHDHRRRCAVRRHLEATLPPEASLPADTQSDPAIAFAVKETETAIEAAIRRLPLDLRTALTLSLLGEMTSQEIGIALGIPAGTVRYRISQARKRLIQDLGLATNGVGKQKENQHGTSK
jgi:RNA polymerase sigma-70 factor (ECF subfamily)